MRRRSRAPGQTTPGPTIATINGYYDNLVRNTDKSVNALVSQVQKATSGNPQVAATVQAANSTAVSQLDQALASVGAALKNEAQSARADAQSVVGSTHFSLVQALTSGRSFDDPGLRRQLGPLRHQQVSAGDRPGGPQRLHGPV